MKNQYLIGLVTGIIVSGVVAVNASQQMSTIQSCASLLPSGHNFEVNITGKIDTTSSTREFNGRFGLSDGSKQENPALQKSAEPFVNCVSSLLK